MTKRDLEIENAHLKGRIVELERRIAAAKPAPNPFDYFKPYQPLYKETFPETTTKIWLNTPHSVPYENLCHA